MIIFIVVRNIEYQKTLVLSQLDIKCRLLKQLAFEVFESARMICYG